MPEKNISVNMIRDSLDDIPEFALPTPYTIRWYQPGDEAAWVRIHVEADQYNTFTPALFEWEFGTEASVLSARQAYLCDGDGLPIGTASAWFKQNYRGQDYGLVHWVAILPPKQGQGLAKPLMSAICGRLRALHHERAYLGTSTSRIPAINLYLKFGFVPEIRHEADRRAWHQVAQKINHPALDLLDSGVS